MRRARIGYWLGWVLWGCVACGGPAPSRSVDPVMNDPYGPFQEALRPAEPLLDEWVVTTTAIGKQPPAAGVQLPPVNPLEIRGDLAIATTPEIHPASEAIYQRFVSQGYPGVMDVNSMTSTTAIELFCTSDTVDILAISRVMSATERQACGARQPLEFPIGKDAVVVVVNREDTFVKQLTLQSLATLLTQENWSNVNPQWPEQPIIRFLVGPQSAAMALVAERVLPGQGTTLGTLPNTTFYKYEQPMVQALSTTRYGVGLLSYATYQRFAKTFRAVSINGVAVGPEAVKKGLYPLGRTLYLYADRQQFKQKPQVSTFINFYLTHGSQDLEDMQLFPLSQPEQDRSRSAWLKAMGRLDRKAR